MDTDKIEYEFRKYASIVYLTDEMVQNIDEPSIKWITDNAYGDLELIAMRLTWELACRDLFDWKYPANWKESFKERWFPKWLLKRYPVIYSYFTLTEIAGIKRSTIEGYPKRYTIDRRYKESDVKMQGM